MARSSHGFAFHKSPAVANVQNAILSYFENLGIDLGRDTSGKNIRALMFECFRTPQFKESYIQLAKSVAEELSIDEQDLVFQSTPTPRILRPGEHGTSFHCDYWYGHGEKFYTVWTPVGRIVPGNTFKMIADPKKSEYHYNRIAEAKGDIGDSNDIITDCVDVLPGEGECAVFGSKTLHGSPENTSDQERISFDFRLGPASDTTSTKDLDSYYRYSDGQYKIFEHSTTDRFLKYICGGRGISTTAQHILIEGVSKNLGLNIVAQEAEIERYGFPMLLMHAQRTSSEGQVFDGIVVASEAVLDDEVVQQLRDRKTRIYFALENKWL